MAFPTGGVRTGYVGTEAIGDVLTKANFDKGPGGLVAYACLTSNPGSIVATTATFTGLSAAFTAGTSRTYHVMISWSSWQSTTAAAGANAFLISNGTTQVDGCLVQPAAINANANGGMYQAIDQPVSGSVTYNFRGFSSGTIQLTNATATSLHRILVFDVAPSF